MSDVVKNGHATVDTLDRELRALRGEITHVREIVDAQFRAQQIALDLATTTMEHKMAAQAEVVASQNTLRVILWSAVSGVGVSLIAHTLLK